MVTVNTLLDAALDCCKRGWSVIPLAGKKPAVDAWERYQDERATEEQVRAWWANQPDANVGIVLGAVSGVVRLDVDGSAGQAKLQEMFGVMPSTPAFRTPTGAGWFFKHSVRCRTTPFWTGEGEHEELKLLADGRYTVVPPSLHPDGGSYEWTLAPWDVELKELPPKIADAVLSAAAVRALRLLEQELGAGDEPPSKALVLDALKALPYEFCYQYDSWLQVGMALKSLGEDMLAHWDDWSQQCVEKYQPNSCAVKWATFDTQGGLTGKSILHWAKQNGWKQPGRYPLTDMGNAARFVDSCRGTALYCHPWGKWLVWDSKRWRVDDTGAIVHSVKTVLLEFFDEATKQFVTMTETARQSDLDSAELRKRMAGKVLQHAIASQSRRSVEAALFLSQCELPVLPKELDTDPWVLNCANGLLDLRTGELRECAKQDRVTKLCPTEYSPNAACPRWEQFLLEVFAEQKDTVSWMQKLLGYCLTGVTAEHVLAILWGGGANGKSTMVTALFDVLGPDYSGRAPRELLLVSRGNQHPTILASLFGKRLVAAVETGDSARLDEVAVKELTSEDPVTCRRMREDFWEFRPTHKLLLATNHKPEVRGTDHAIWRRLRLVPFTVTFDGERKDLTLAAKLKQEAPGVLRWLVEGCMRWQREGLDSAVEVATATTSYRQDQDRLTEFLESCYVRDGQCKVKCTDLLVKYTNWCREQKEVELSGRLLTQALAERNLFRDEAKKHYIGLRDL